MEKRTILAFVLSFVILVGWAFFFSPKTEQVQEAEKGTKKEMGGEAPALSKSPPPPQDPGARVQTEVGSPAAQTAQVAEKEVMVDTPLYQAVFTTAGPTLRSLRLKNYRQTADPKSPPIEIVHTGKGVDGFLRVDFEPPAGQGPGKTIYQESQGNVVLDPGSAPMDLVFRHEGTNGVQTSKVFRLYPDQYIIDLTVEVSNTSQQPHQGAFVAEIKALPPTEKSGSYSFVGLALLLGKELKELEIEKPSSEEVFKGEVLWLAYEDDYFISAIIPEKTAYAVAKGKRSASGALEGTYIPPSVTVAPSGQASMRYSLYFGPRDMEVLKQVGHDLDRAVNFGWTDIIARPLLYVLRFFERYLHNYGLAIIVLTILVKILFWPLTHKSYKSMKEMQKLQPIMAKIREKHKNDKQKMNQEMMGLYKTYKVNPMGGCLPMVIQIPVFFALFRVLGSSIELRHAPFLLWINDLSAPDRLFHFPFEIPLMTPPYGIPILTLLMGASMFIQQKMTPTPGDPSQAKIMMLMPVIFTFMFINFPSGLVLYWLINNILSIGQQYRIQKRPA